MRACLILPMKRSFALLLSLLTTLGAPTAALAEPTRPPAPLVAPTPFLWGVTIGGYQNDGGSAGMDMARMQQDGKLPEACGRGPDFRAHMDADLDRAQSLGLNAFRFSLEWARLEPQRGHYDPAEIAYVHRLIRAIKARGMTPIVTIHHFVSPTWAVGHEPDGRAGWERPQMVADFLDYVRFVAREFGPEIHYYLTINEPSTVILGGYTVGFLYPYRVGPGSLIAATRNVIAAHEGAYRILHRMVPGCQVSLPDYNCALPFGHGLDWRPGDLMARTFGSVRGWDGALRPKYLDFIAMHYYGTNRALTAFPIEPYHWDANPQDFLETMRGYYRSFHLPILIAESGFATENGLPRQDGWTQARYLVTHAQAIAEARREGLPIMGYLYWTLTDSYEWGTYSARFGLWDVEVRSGDLTRVERPGAEVYREIAAHDGPTPDLIKRYGERL